jgi:hypothetical protein
MQILMLAHEPLSQFFRRVISEVMGGKMRDNYNPKQRCEGWDSGQQVLFSNRKFWLNFEMKTNSELFATAHK